MKLSAFIPFILIILLNGCDKFNLTPEITINFQDPTNITESGFQISWSINSADYQSLTFILAEDPGFERVISSEEFRDRSVRSTAFESLRGADTYYYRISLLKAPGSIYISQTKSIELPFVQEFVTIPTPDSASLKGSLYYRGALNEKRPAVILMHEFGIFVNGWINSDMLKALVAEGYICMIFSNRGHGQSSYIENIQDLIDDPRYLANDLRGALAFISQNERVMADSICLMGASMGATASVRGNGDPAVRISVALSPANMDIGYMFPEVPLQSILYIVGDQDIVNTGNEVIDFPAHATYLYEITHNPRKLLVIENSKAHGTELLESTGVKDANLQWITTRMPVILNQ